MCAIRTVFLLMRRCADKERPLTDWQIANTSTPANLLLGAQGGLYRFAELQETLIKGFWRVMPLSMRCPIDFKMIGEPGVYKLAHFTSNLSLQYRLLFSKCVIISMITEQQVHGLAFIVCTCTFNFAVLLQVYTCTSNNNVIKPLRLKTPYTNQ